MSISLQEVAQLEWANYAATLPIAQVTPGLHVLLRDEVIITSNTLFPYLDVTHACLVRACSENVDRVIDRVINYFRLRALPTTFFISPACTPANLGKRLQERGFTPTGEEEAWLIYPQLSCKPIPPFRPNIEIRQINPYEATTFVEVMVAAFEMPVEFIPVMLQLTEPSIGLPEVHHYLAFIDGQPVGTCSLMGYQNFGVLGGAGVIPAYRGSGTIFNLVIRAAIDARDRGIDTLILQTAAATPLERMLRISGFKKIFTRVAYTLNDRAGQN